MGSRPPTPTALKTGPSTSELGKLYLQTLRHSFRPLLFVGFPEGYWIIYVPESIRYTSGHSWRHAKCTMNFDEVVREIIQRRCSRVIFQFAREAIRQTSVTAHRGANRPI